MSIILTMSRRIRTKDSKPLNYTYRRIKENLNRIKDANINVNLTDAAAFYNTTKGSEFCAIIFIFR